MTFRWKPINGEARVDLTKIYNTIIPSIPYWTIRTPKVILTLCKLHKTKTHALISQEELEKVKNRCPRHLHIFTDRSKQEKTTGFAAIYNEKKTKKCLPNDTTIFNTEACTLDIVLDLVFKLKKKKSS